MIRLNDLKISYRIGSRTIDAVDGVSLTVNELPEPGVVQLSLIEYTLRHTTLGDLRHGDAVHVEADVIGKYVQRLVEPYTHSAPQGLRPDR